MSICTIKIVEAFPISDPTQLQTITTNDIKKKLKIYAYSTEQEAQLMLTNPHDVFRGQSRSPNRVTVHMLGSFLFYNSNFCPYDVLVIRYSTSKICRDLEIGVRGQSRSLKVVPFG